jgi:predicted transcriptional regulator
MLWQSTAAAHFASLVTRASRMVADMAIPAVLVDLDDGLTADDRVDLLASIAASTADIDAGRTAAYEDVMSQLRARTATTSATAG